MIPRPAIKRTLNTYIAKDGREQITFSAYLAHLMAQINGSYLLSEACPALSIRHTYE
jgi:hypothetical protein